MPFLTELDVILKDNEDDLWELDRSLIYRDKLGALWEVPRGFTCDMASIPRLPLTWWLFKGADTHRAGVLHDWLCRQAEQGLIQRAHADEIFYEALRDDGVGIIRAKAMWAAVRGYSLFSASRR